MSYTLNDIQFNVVKTNTKPTVEYINIECGFDIESTSTSIGEDEKASFMYAWAFGLKDEKHIYRGRTWEEFTKLCDSLVSYFELNSKRRLVCYIHNLGYEFQFMRKFFEWDNVFSTDSRKPIKALTKNGIEFRDSLILSGSSLRLVADNLINHTITKKIGQLDYSKVRHYTTPLTEDEWEYIEHDVLILLYYINEQISMYGSVNKIPLTNTARVRDYVRNQCYFTSKSHKNTDKNKYNKYRNLMKELRMDEDTYKACKKAFQGGYVHASAKHSNKVIEDVTSADFISSYPAVMCSEKFPMSAPIKIKREDFMEAYQNNNMCFIFTIKVKNIISNIDQDCYISESHCRNLVNPVINNGRIFSADELTTTITDVDFDIISTVYDIEDIDVFDIYGFYKQYLPKPIIESIIELYEKKTMYKGVEGKEEEYTLSKDMLNAVYGMTVADIVKDDNVYNDEWIETEGNVKEKIEAYNNSHRRFLYYPWGVFVTAYARKNLWSGIVELGDDYVYSDTDAIKFLNAENHIEYLLGYNFQIGKKIEYMCKYHNIDQSRLSPKTQDGEEKPLGEWDIDGNYSKFKTLGAKRYIVEHKGTGELELTCSGLGKDEGIDYLKELHGSNLAVMEAFNDEMHIPAHATGKMAHTYIDHEITTTLMDYLGNVALVTSPSSVHLEEAEYNLSMAEEHIRFMENIQRGYVFKGQKRLS